MHTSPLIATVVASVVVATPAFAADSVGVVDAIFVRSPAGAWVSVASSADAKLRGAAGEVTLRVGQAVSTGDVLRTALVRVRLRLHSDEQVIVGEGSEVVVGERSWLQRAGDLMYRVHGLFRVQFGSIEAAVEGTRFVVRPQRVDVVGGAVTVRDADDASTVVAGTTVDTSGGEVHPPPTRLTPDQRASVRSFGRMLGQPTWSVGVEVGGGLFEERPVGAFRLVARGGFARIGEGFFDVGVITASDRFHLPITAGLGLRAGVLRLGAGFSVRLGACVPCVAEGRAPTEARFGAALQAGAVVPLGGRVNFSATLRADTAGRTFTADFGAGLMIGL